MGFDMLHELSHVLPYMTLGKRCDISNHLERSGSTLAGVYTLQRPIEWEDIEFFSRIGKLGFIYQTTFPKIEQGLVIGTGENIWSATAVFRWSEGEEVWKNFEDRSLAGGSEGTTASEVQLTQIPDTMDLNLLKNETLLKEEKPIPGVDNATGPLGIICLSPKKKEKTFISFNDTEAGWHCDRTWHCQFGGFHFISSFRHYSSLSSSLLLLRFFLLLVFLS